MTKQELYRDLCVEAGTYPPPSVLAEHPAIDGVRAPSADEWYIECSHNIHGDLDRNLEAAARGDSVALAECRRLVGLPPFC